MIEKKEVKGELKYERDTKRHYRFQVITNTGIVGTIYVPKTTESMPKRLVLQNEGKAK